MAVGDDRAADDIAAIAELCAVIYFDLRVCTQMDLTVQTVGCAGDGLIACQSTANHQHSAVGNGQGLAIGKRQHDVHILPIRREAKSGFTGEGFVGIGVLGHARIIGIVGIDGLLSGRVGQQQGSAGGDRQVLGLRHALQKDDHVAINGIRDSSFKRRVVFAVDLRHRVGIRLKDGRQRYRAAHHNRIGICCSDRFAVFVLPGFEDPSRQGRGRGQGQFRSVLCYASSKFRLNLNRTLFCVAANRNRIDVYRNLRIGIAVVVINNRCRINGVARLLAAAFC